MKVRSDELLIRAPVPVALARGCRPHGPRRHARTPGRGANDPLLHARAHCRPRSRRSSAPLRIRPPLPGLRYLPTATPPPSRDHRGSPTRRVRTAAPSRPHSVAGAPHTFLEVPTTRFSHPASPSQPLGHSCDLCRTSRSAGRLLRALTSSCEGGAGAARCGMPRNGSDAAGAGAAEEVPQSVRNLLTKARTAWLKNTEVLDLLSNYQRYNFSLNKTTPNNPPGARLLRGLI